MPEARSSGPKHRIRKRIDRLTRIIGAVAVVTYLLGGAVYGLWQQSEGLAQESMDCEYRAQLLRDRLVTMLDYEQSSNHRTGTDEKFSHLLDQTSRVCAVANPSLTDDLNKLRQGFEQFQVRRSQAADARMILSVRN